MESVKLAGLGTHAPQILYPGGRQPPPGPQPAHPPPTSRHDGSPYKTAISPPMGSRAGAGGYPAYPPSAEVGGGGGRYLQQPPFVPYPREPTHYVRPASDRPAMLPHGTRRPTIMGPFGPYSRAGADVLWPYTHSRSEMLPQLVPSNPLAVSTTMDSSKRIKLSQPIKPESRVPLVIDTSDNNHSNRESTYTPQVEAISPTLPSDPRDESPLRSTKDDLLKHIEKVDREIAKAESSIAKLRKKEIELQDAAQKGDGPKPEEEDTKEPRHHSVAQIIYAENRKRAEESHNTLDKLMPPTDVPTVLPLYHQPTDTEVFLANKRHYAGFKRRLLEYFKRKHAAKNDRDSHLTHTYSKLMTIWLKKIEKMENSKKHKEKVAKNRELFEKVFPELRKQREEKERFTRVGARVKSDAEMEEIMDGLQEQENEDKKMRAYAVIPPILLEERRRKQRYLNQNGLIDDPSTEYKEYKNINIWTDQERDIFREKYLQHPKNFVVIGSYLERKSVSDCIQYYYSTKKKENYKMLVKRRIRRPRNKPNNQPVVEVLGMNSTGVTTRGSVAALRTQQPSGRPGMGICAGSGQDEPTNYSVSAQPPTSSTTSMLHTANTTITPATSPVPSHTNSTDQPSSSAPLPPSSTMPSDLSTSSTTTTTTTTTASTLSSKEVQEKDKENLSVNDNKSGVGGGGSILSDKQQQQQARHNRKDKDKSNKDAQDSSDDDNTAEHGKGGPHECLMCKTRLEHYGQSRAVMAGQAGQYGLTEALLPPNPRVCNGCRCRAVRRRVTQCPVPTCSTPKWRVKRLRPLPPQWADLPSDVKDPIIRDFQLPSDLSKCCSSCHNRISRRLGPAVEEPVDPSRWSEDDVDALRNALREVGCHWSKVAERVANKTEGQCKSFYFNFKKKYKYDDVVAEYRKARGKGEGPPTVTDEEESGSTTSSCEEDGSVPPPPPPSSGGPGGPDSDTASAPSPPPQTPHHNNIDEKCESSGVMKEPAAPMAAGLSGTGAGREDNDSSATASAEEVGEAGRDSPEVQHIPHPGERRPPAPSKAPQHPQPQNPAGGKGEAAGVASSNVRDLIYITIEKSLEGKLPNQPTKSPPTIQSILKAHGRSVPPQSSPAGLDYRDQRLPIGYTDPRAGLPSVSTPTFHTQDVQIEGLDLSIHKRNRSVSPHHPAPPHQQPPPPSQASSSLPPPHPHQPPPSQPHSVTLAAPVASPRDLPPTMTVRGGAEVTITSKDPPPRAHLNASYSKSSHQEPWPHSDHRNKSPSPFVSDSRGNLAHQPAIAMTSVVTGGGGPMVYTSQRPPQHSQQPPNKPKVSMAPPPPMSTVRAGHPQAPQPNTGPRIPMKEKQGSPHVGSITQGTPVNPPPVVSVPISQSPRFDMVAKPTSLLKDAGSITQGTPIHHDQKRPGPANPYKDVIFEPRPGSGVEIIPRPAPTSQYERDMYRGPRPAISTAPATTAYYPGYHYTTRPPYSDSQISSRQIIATDYLTSQQMLGRRVVGEKESHRVSPRGRDHSPQQEPRGHQAVPAPTSINRIMDSRGMDHRTLDIRMVEQRPIEMRNLDPRSAMDPRMDPRAAMDPRIVDIRTTDPRAVYYPPGSYQSPAQPPSAPVYLPDRIPRPPQSPANRDATPTPPTSEPAPSPHEFRSPGVSTPTPPPRAGVIQRPRSTPKPHLPPSKSVSPRTEPGCYSPRHTPGSENFPALVDITVARTSAPYPGSIDTRRDGLSHHDTSQPEGLGQQLTDISRTVGRTMNPNKHEIRGPPQDSRGLPPQQPPMPTHSQREDGRFYDPRADYERLRNTGKNSDSKGDLENDASSGMAGSFQKDKLKPTKPQGRSQSETLTAANLIDAIITHQINNNSAEGGGACGAPGGEQQRTFRREGEGGLQVVELDKRVRSPAGPPPQQLGKEKEIVMVEDSPDPRPGNPINHKEGLPTGLHPNPHHQTPKSMQAHMDQIIHKEFSSSDARKMPSAHLSYSNRPPFEIVRTDGRPIVASGAGAPPAVTVSQVYEHWKMRGGEKDTKDRLDNRSPHRPPPTTAPSATHHLSAQHLSPDERQIIRIAQPVSPRPDHKLRTPPAAPAGSFPVEPISPPTSSAPPTSDPNHSENNMPLYVGGKRPYQPQVQSKEVFEYVRYKIAEVMRGPDSQDAQEKLPYDDRHPRTPTPVSQGTGPQQNTHHDPEDPTKKRPRPDMGDQRPPSRPRSTSGDAAKDRRDDQPTRDDVADSPQSGEMVIDETPRDHPRDHSRDHAHPRDHSRDHPRDHSRDHPPTSKAGDSVGKVGSKVGEAGDRYPPGNGGPGSQYPYPYSSFRGHGPPSVGSTGGPPPPPTTITTTRATNPQGYEPNVEPVSDED